MSIYESPDFSKTSYIIKFVRVGDDIAVTAPGDINTSHITLAVNDELLARLKKIKI